MYILEKRRCRGGAGVEECRERKEEGDSEPQDRRSSRVGCFGVLFGL